jgi:hypothetical protein
MLLWIRAEVQVVLWPELKNNEFRSPWLNPMRGFRGCNPHAVGGLVIC